MMMTWGMQLRLEFHTPCLIEMHVNSGYVEGHARSPDPVLVCVYTCMFMWEWEGVPSLHFTSFHSVLNR